MAKTQTELKGVGRKRNKKLEKPLLEYLQSKYELKDLTVEVSRLKQIAIAEMKDQNVEEYLLVDGEQAKWQHVVPTFEQPQGEYRIGTPAEQTEFFDRWVLTLRV